MKDSVLFAVGTYTRDMGWVQGKGEGIYLFDFDPNKTSRRLSVSEPTVNPSYLVLHPSKDLLYAVNEMGGSSEEPSGFLSSFRIDRERRCLERISSVSSLGAGPCFVAADPLGEFLYVANYGSGSVGVLPLNGEGVPEPPGWSVQHSGEKEPHAHMALPSPDGRFVLVSDLGLDRIYSYCLDRKNRSLQPCGFIQTAEGAGPRHLIFHPELSVLYCINELAGSLDVYAFNLEEGGLSRQQGCSLIRDARSGPAHSADLAISSTGRFLYATNRGTRNELLTFEIDQNTGQLSFLRVDSAGGRIPRNLCFDPSGRFLLVAHQDSGRISVFEPDPERGSPGKAVQEIEVPSPVCIRFLQDFPRRRTSDGVSP